jgi:hypothetical protein
MLSVFAVAHGLFYDSFGNGRNLAPGESQRKKGGKYADDTKLAQTVLF